MSLACRHTAGGRIIRHERKHDLPRGRGKFFLSLDEEARGLLGGVLGNFF